MRLRRTLATRWGGKTADRVLRVSAVACVGMLLVSVVMPAGSPLVLFMLVTLWTNGPYSPVLPAAYEPVLMLFGTLYPPILIGVLGTIGTVYMEYLNYHLYVAGADRLPERVRDSRLLTAVVRWYERAPFVTIVVAALTPIPYWLVRVLSALTRYSPRRHLAATGIGRFPRLWFVAAIATPLHLPTVWLVMVTVAVLGAGVLAAAMRIVRRKLAARRAVRSPSVAAGAEVTCCS